MKRIELAHVVGGHITTIGQCFKITGNSTYLSNGLKMNSHGQIYQAGTLIYDVAQDGSTFDGQPYGMDVYEVTIQGPEACLYMAHSEMD